MTSKNNATSSHANCISTIMSFWDCKTWKMHVYFFKLELSWILKENIHLYFVGMKQIMEKSNFRNKFQKLTGHALRWRADVYRLITCVRHTYVLWRRIFCLNTFDSADFVIHYKLPAHPFLNCTWQSFVSTRLFIQCAVSAASPQSFKVVR